MQPAVLEICFPPGGSRGGGSGGSGVTACGSCTRLLTHQPVRRQCSNGRSMSSPTGRPAGYTYASAGGTMVRRTAGRWSGSGYAGRQVDGSRPTRAGCCVKLSRRRLQSISIAKLSLPARKGRLACRRWRRWAVTRMAACPGRLASAAGQNVSIIYRLRATDPVHCAWEGSYAQ